ncbi:hypothetical protein EVAR_40158_1 [Eumeta japonica]|uniref:Uncharacterized protein n=1 Tax=Eumeta variegata TaxID=151549 RepID=A0A4C1YE60_EUMVA|nr:hypothetical protein EVAR_40158_1 [Eumeta japonica]
MANAEDPPRRNRGDQPRQTFTNEDYGDVIFCYGYCNGDSAAARRGSIAWLARCPDLTPMDFYVWGHIKTLVYDASPVATRDEIIFRITSAADEMKRNLSPEITKSVLRHRMRACIRNRG